MLAADPPLLAPKQERHSTCGNTPITMTILHVAHRVGAFRRALRRPRGTPTGAHPAESVPASAGPCHRGPTRRCARHRLRAVRRSGRAGAVALPPPRRRGQPGSRLHRPARPRRPRPLAASDVLGGLTPADVRESRERHAAQPDPRRAGGGRGPHRPPPACERAGPRKERPYPARLEDGHPPIEAKPRVRCRRRPPGRRPRRY